MSARAAAIGFAIIGVLGVVAGIWVIVYGDEFALVGSGITILSAWIAGTAAAEVFR